MYLDIALEKLKPFRNRICDTPLGALVLLTAAAVVPDTFGNGRIACSRLSSPHIPSLKSCSDRLYLRVVMQHFFAHLPSPAGLLVSAEG